LPIASNQLEAADLRFQQTATSAGKQRNPFALGAQVGGCEFDLGSCWPSIGTVKINKLAANLSASGAHRVVRALAALLAAPI